MRYLFIIIALWCCSISGKAQTDSVQVKKPLYSVRKEKDNRKKWDERQARALLESDKVSAKGLRHIKCSQRTASVEKGENGLNIGLEAFVSETDTTYKISCKIVSSKFEPNMEEGSPALFKLRDGTLLELRVDFVYQPLPQIMAMFGTTYTTYILNFSATINEENFEQLQMGVSKIRVEVNHTPYDVILKNDNLSKFLIDEYNLINNSLMESKTFYDDF